MRSATIVDDNTGTVTRTRVVRSSPCGKRLYASKKEARAKAAERRKATGENLGAYHCYRCHGYHLGHRPGEPRQLP